LKTLNTYISSLLEIHDCVIIPDFGGFLLNISPAAFGGNGHELHPASKIVSFNRNLNINDGLLANFIASTENVSYTEALSFLKDEVSDLKSILNLGLPVKCPYIGTLVQNEENRLVFSPDTRKNYLTSSFGLPGLVLIPAEKQLSRIRKINEYQVNPEKIRRSRPVAATLAVAASLIFAMIIFLKNNAVEPGKIAMALYRDHTVQPVAESVNKIINDSENATKTIQPANPNLNYYIVGGSFKKEANARAFVQKLKKKGFQARVLNTENGFFRVTYYQESDSIIADKALHDIKNSENQSAWLLKW
jgi:hypothetical protein